MLTTNDPSFNEEWFTDTENNGEFSMIITSTSSDDERSGNTFFILASLSNYPGREVWKTVNVKIGFTCEQSSLSLLTALG